MFNNKSTPKKLQNYLDENDKRITVDIIYSELQDVKDKMNISCYDCKSNMDKLEYDLKTKDKYIDDLIKKVAKHEESISSMHREINKFQENLNNYKYMDNNIKNLESKIDDLTNEINNFRNFKNDNDMENILKKQLQNYCENIKSSMDKHMIKITNIFNESLDLDTNSPAFERSTNAKISEFSESINIIKSTESFSPNISTQPSSTFSSSIIKESPKITDNFKTMPPVSFNKEFENGTGNETAFLSRKSTPLFGDSKSPGKFGDSKLENVSSLFVPKTQTTSIFNIKGDSIFSSKPQSAILFSNSKGSNSESMFGLKSQTVNLFGEKTPLFGSKPQSAMFSNVNSSKETNVFANLTSAAMAEQPASTCPFNFNPVINVDTPSFSNLSKSDSNVFPSQSESKWQGGSKLFATNANTPENNDENSEQIMEEEHDPHFQPIIDLPPLVAIQKDEESHDILFKSRCKLYRFINNEWKERGVGEMKIMKTKKSIDISRPVKLLMRREQVRKICCNQRISKNVPAFAEMPNVKSTCWVGNDFSEGESSQEKFAIRFSHVDELNKFKSIVEKVQSEMSSNVELN